MTVRHGLIVLFITCGIAGRAAAEEDDRPVGIVTLRTESLSKPVAALVNAQLSQTLEAVARRKVVPITLPAGALADDEEALRSAAGLSDLFALVGGSVSADKDPGEVRLLWVPETGLPRSIVREVPGNGEATQRAAIDAAACALLGKDGNTQSCQAPVELEGNVPSAELDVDGKRVMRVSDVAGPSIDVGTHVARGCDGDDCSTKRRLDITRNAALSLRIVKECNRMHLLGPAESPDCGGAVTTEVVPLIIETTTPVNWKGVIALAVGGAAIVAGTIFGLQANSEKAAYEDGYANGGLSADAAKGHVDAMNGNATRANVSFAVGGVAALAGGAMLAFDF